MKNLSSLSQDPTNKKSIWMNKKTQDMVILLANTMNWCSKTKKAVFFKFT